MAGSVNIGIKDDTIFVVKTLFSANDRSNVANDLKKMLKPPWYQKG